MIWVSFKERCGVKSIHGKDAHVSMQMAKAIAVWSLVTFVVYIQVGPSSAVTSSSQLPT